MSSGLINEDASKETLKMYEKIFKLITRRLDEIMDNLDDNDKTIRPTTTHEIEQEKEVEEVEEVENETVEVEEIEHYTEEIPKGYIEYEFEPQRYIPPRETFCIEQNDYVAEEFDNIVDVDERNVEILEEEEIKGHYEELEHDILSPIKFDDDVEL